MRGLAILLFVAVPLLAQTGSEPPSSPNRKLPVARRHAPTRGIPAGPAQQVLVAENRLREAATTGKLEAAEAILSSDYTLTLPDGDMLDRQRLVAALRQGMLSDVSMGVSDMRVRMLGTVAAVVTAQVEVKQQSQTRLFRLLDVWNKQSQDWKLVSSQITEIRPRM